MLTLITILPLIVIYTFTAHLAIKEFCNEPIDVMEEVRIICNAK